MRAVLSQRDWPIIGTGDPQIPGPLLQVVLAISFVGWVTLARLVRGQMLALKDMEYVMAARALGASERRVVFVHMLPNTLGPVIVAVTFGIPTAIFAEAFVGLGVFQEIADGASADRADDGGVLEDGGEGDDLGIGALTADVADGSNPIHHRHQEVHEDDIGFEVMGEFEGIGAVLGFADDLEVGVIEEEHLESLADDCMVVGDHDPDGHESSGERSSDSGTRLRYYITAFGVNLPPPFGGDRVPSKFSCVNQPAVGRCARRLRLLLEG